MAKLTILEKIKNLTWFNLIEQLQDILPNFNKRIEILEENLDDGSSSGGGFQTLDQTLENGNVGVGKTIELNGSNVSNPGKSILSDYSLSYTNEGETFPITSYNIGATYTSDPVTGDILSYVNYNSGRGNFNFPNKIMNQDYNIAVIDDISLQGLIDTDKNRATTLDNEGSINLLVDDPTYGKTFSVLTSNANSDIGVLELNPGYLTIQHQIGNDKVQMDFTNGEFILTNQKGSFQSTISFRNPIAQSNFYLPAKTVDGEYDLATLDDIPTIVPVSASVSGIVNNTSLQELGGVDKTINGVRIGAGNFYSNTNTALGYLTLSVNSAGIRNTAIGSLVLGSLTTGNSNTSIGNNSNPLTTTGSFNTVVGSSSFVLNTAGNQNVVVGHSALNRNITGIQNTALGGGALGGVLNVSDGNNSRNTAVGFFAGINFELGNDNLFIGSDIPTGSPGIGKGLATGNKNIILGKLDNTLRTGDNNTFIGWAVSPATTLSNNVIIADGAGNIAIRKTATNELLAPTLTNALITSGGNKSIITKEYLDSRRNEQGQIKVNYTGLSTVGFVAETLKTLDINSATPTIVSSPTTTYPFSTPNNYGGFFDSTRGTSPTGRLIENPINGQVHTWRFQINYSNKIVSNNGSFDLILTNPVSGFQYIMPFTLPSGRTSGTLNNVAITIADGASIPAPNGYILQCLTSFTDANLTIDSISITRISQAKEN